MPSSPAVAVTLADFMIEPGSLSLSGSTFAFAVTSNGPTPHNFSIKNTAGETIAGSGQLSAGESEVVTAELAPAEYTIFCALPGHASLGMRGTLTVTAP